jgi:uncharacterized membrane protein
MIQDRPPPPPPRSLLHPRVVAAGAALLLAGFITDVCYWRTLLVQWENFSMWLLTGGLVVALLAGLLLALDAALGRLTSIAWGRFCLLTAAALISFVNAFVHSRDAYAAVVPQGLALSAVVAALLLIVGARGWGLSAETAPHATLPRSLRS